MPVGHQIPLYVATVDEESMDRYNPSTRSTMWDKQAAMGLPGTIRVGRTDHAMTDAKTGCVMIDGRSYMEAQPYMRSQWIGRQDRPGA